VVKKVQHKFEKGIERNEKVTGNPHYVLCMRQSNRLLLMVVASLLSQG